MDINSEVKDQNKMLDSMGTSLGSATDLFKSTIGKMGLMLTSASGNHMYYLIIFIVFVFLTVYYLMSRK